MTDMLPVMLNVESAAPGATPGSTPGMDRIGTALADPIRRAVLVELLAGPACPSDLAGRVGASRTNLSNHLACLRGCGLIRADRDGRFLHYQLVSAELADALRSLTAVAESLPPCPDHRP